jgi:D-alanyl-D-alanine carboxypeptidase
VVAAPAERAILSGSDPGEQLPDVCCDAAMRMRFAFLALLVALTSVLIGCRGEASTAPPVERVAQQIARAGTTSVIVLVSDDGREYVATAGTRRPDPNQRFRIGSVTKTFTAAIVLQLVEEGRLRLDNTLDEHLPGLGARAEEITIRQLLNHRSGLVNLPTTRPGSTRRAGRHRPGR